MLQKKKATTTYGSNTNTNASLDEKKKRKGKVNNDAEENFVVDILDEDVDDSRRPALSLIRRTSLSVSSEGEDEVAKRLQYENAMTTSKKKAAK